MKDLDFETRLHHYLASGDIVKELDELYHKTEYYFANNKGRITKVVRPKRNNPPKKDMWNRFTKDNQLTKE